jgi:hypothetical protein
MPLYCFDMRDDDQFYPDDQGTELDGGLVAARIVAFATLADYIQGRIQETDFSIGRSDTLPRRCHLTPTPFEWWP